MNNVLFVDDERHILHSMKLAFRNEGFNLHFSNSPLKALEMVRNNEMAVIVSDNMMPELNGVDLLSKIKKISPYSIRILLTGECNEECIVKSINFASIYQYIPKPFNGRDLVKTIHKAVRLYEESRLVGKLKKGNINLIGAIQRYTVNDLDFNVKWLDKSELKVGMTLDQDLKNNRGILMMKKGRVLNFKDIELIASLEILHKIPVQE